jgi:hypothetical protein
MSSSIRVAVIFIVFLCPVALPGSQFQLQVIEDETDLPEPFCDSWEKGDFLVSFGNHLALLGGTSRRYYSVLNYPMGDMAGCIVAVVPSGKGHKSELTVGSPYLRIKNQARFVAYSSVEKVDESPQGVIAKGRYSGPQGWEAEVQTDYQFDSQSGRVDIHSTLRNTGVQPIEDFDYSVYVNANTRYAYGFSHEGEQPKFRFRIHSNSDQSMAFVEWNPSVDEEAQTLAPGESRDVRYSMLVDATSSVLLEKLYSMLDVETEKATLQFEEVKGRVLEVIVTEVVSGTVFYRSFLTDRHELTVPLPAGVYSARVNFFPAVQEEVFSVIRGGDNTCTLRDAPMGKLNVRITDGSDAFIPGKVTFVGLDSTPTPYFEPVNPMKSGGVGEGRKNSRYPGKDGLDVELPVGTYLVYASRGPEYSLDQNVIEITEAKLAGMTFVLSKALDTGGLVSIDPHMHTQHSDGYMSVADRVRSVVAEGVDVAVPTDHNYVTDYQPWLTELGLDEHLSVMTGNEVTINGMIHYNTFPVAYAENELHHGAIDPLSDTVTPLFQSSRRKDPGTLIQVNHPRSGDIGYFNIYGLDRESAAFALEGFDTSFDVLEIVNGPWYGEANAESIEDWLHLLNRGYYFPLVGSSDSHGIDGSEPGYSRTYVHYEGATGKELDREALIRAMKQGRSFSSNGPIIDFQINGSCSLGDTCTDEDGDIEVRLRVQSAPWVSVDEVRLIVNGKRDKSISIEKEGTGPLDVTKSATFRLTEDSYVVAEVVGTKSLYPVVQIVSDTGSLEDAVLPYALTNPIFIDVDGNGRFDPPIKGKIKLLQTVPETN